MPAMTRSRDHRRARARRVPDRRLLGARRRRRDGRTARPTSRIAASSDASRYCAERQQRPEDDVAVRIAGTDAALALEEHEPLRPVAVGVLLLRRRAPAGRASARTGRARAAARPGPGTRRACPSRRRSTAPGRAARGSGSARCARTTAGSPAAARPSAASPVGASSATRPAMPFQKRSACARRRQARPVGRLGESRAPAIEMTRDAEPDGAAPARSR